MSEAKCGSARRDGPGYRFAHPGYACCRHNPIRSFAPVVQFSFATTERMSISFKTRIGNRCVAGNAISNRHTNSHARTRLVLAVVPHGRESDALCEPMFTVFHHKGLQLYEISYLSARRLRLPTGPTPSDRLATVVAAHRTGESRRGSRAQVRVSLRALRLATLVFALIVAMLDCIVAMLDCGSGYAKSYMSEFLSYQTICSVVEVNSDPRLEGRFDRDLINRSIASVAASQLHERRIDVPIESGRQCFPGKVGVAPRQLSLQFHVTVACGPHSCASMTLAVVLYTFYAGIERAPGSYPTIISYCDNGVELSNCLLQKVTAYFDEVVVPIFESVQQIRKDGTK